MTPEFWKGRRILLTGHTGFKGAWCAALLARLRARVTGFALAPEAQPALWEEVAPRCDVKSRIGDIGDAAALGEAVAEANPEIVLHFAAQSLVREGYRRPLDTFRTNVLGTAQLLDLLRGRDGLAVVLIVTSDKVYRNIEDGRPFAENDPLGGSDPYSASKAACELLVHAYAESYFAGGATAVATARGGNVIGGGDWSRDRLVPDIARAFKAGEPVGLRNPRHARPWQHVLDCLDGYLVFAEKLAAGETTVPALNIGPWDLAEATVADIAEAIGHRLPGSQGWVPFPDAGPAEKRALRLDVSLAERAIGWRAALPLGEAIGWTAEWYAAEAEGMDAWTLTSRQIERYIALRGRT